MKKSYNKPAAQAVKLFVEDDMLLTISGGKRVDAQFSEQKGWNSDDWSGVVEEEDLD